MKELSKVFSRILRPTARPPRGADFPVVPRGQVVLSNGRSGSIGQLFLDHKGAPTSKWAHYLDIYDSYLSQVRDRCALASQETHLLEIGVAEGGSLEIWSQYFGSKSKIVGLDIEPQVSANLPQNVILVTGSQADRNVLQACAQAVDHRIDVVIDDGSHRGKDQITSFIELWPDLSEGAVYIVEDLHTAYWSDFGGGRNRRGTFIHFARGLVDDMHLSYHRKPTSQLGVSATRSISSVAFYDSVVVVTKGQRGSPVRVDAGLGK